MRDEAHRFAITYNRKVRTKRTMLLKHFGSVKRIKAASIEELTQLKGITKELAERVKGG